MKAKLSEELLLVVMGVVVSLPAYAQIGNMYQRCEEDSLNAEEARGRVAWYAKNYPAEITAKARRATGREVTLEQAMVWYNRSMLEDPVFGGPAEYPRYPTFTTPQAENPDPKYFAPKDPNAPADKPANLVWIGDCLSGCYKPGVAVLFAGEDGGYRDVAIDEAIARSVPKVATLSDESTLQSPRLTTNDVAFYVQSLTETDNDIFELTMASGRKLQVTGGHPLIDSAGVVREARTFETGDKLVRMDGTQDPIVSITYEAFHGRVYNVASVAPSLLGQVVVANGYLSGSAWYQNNGLRHMNRALLRSSLPADVLQ